MRLKRVVNEGAFPRRASRFQRWIGRSAGDVNLAPQAHLFCHRAAERSIHLRAMSGILSIASTFGGGHSHSADRAGSQRIPS
jgi:hypothetical protein